MMAEPLARCLAAVRADLDANVPVAREEIIRYSAPAQWFARTVRHPYEIHGVTLQPGQRVIALLGSAARDAAPQVRGPPERSLG